MQSFTSSNFQRTGDWESSSVEPITWGKRVQPNHEEDLKRRNDIPKDKQANEEEIQPTPHTNDARSEAEDNTQTDAREKYKEDPRYHNNSNKATNQRVESSSVAHEGRDDEQEFPRIPIAGEDSEDYNSSNDSDNDDKDTKIIYKNNMTRIQDPLPTLPVVEPLPLAPTVEPLTYSPDDYLDDVPRSPLTAEDIAYLIGHTDGTVQSHQSTSIPTHVNTFQLLHEVNDKQFLTQNMQGMTRGYYTRKLTKE